MNRHIYGLTLFLIIVKIHFLLYWAFFAPINFFSSPEQLKNHAVIITNEPRTMSCNRNKERYAVLQNAALDIENMKVSANVRFSNLETAFDANDFVPFLRIFNEETNETVILKPIRRAEANSVVTFQGDLPKNEKWNPKSNYYTQIDFENGGSRELLKGISSIEQAVPVLIISDKNR